MRQSTPLPDGVDLVPITTSELPELARVLKASYVETQDCPNWWFSAASMTSSKAMEPWVRLNRGAGCCSACMDRSRERLVNRASDGGGELVYLGLSREVRGNGYGQMMLDHALHRVAASQCQMTLAVDSRNTPGVSSTRERVSVAPPDGTPSFGRSWTAKRGRQVVHRLSTTDSGNMHLRSSAKTFTP